MGTEDNKTNVSADLFWIKEALKEIKESVKHMTANYVTKTDVAELKKAGDTIHEDFEVRIRVLEKFATEFSTKIQQWGLVAGLIFTLLNIVISKYL